MELLRKHQLGVATFLILEKQRGLAAAMEEKVKTPEGASAAVICVHAMCKRAGDILVREEGKSRPSLWCGA